MPGSASSWLLDLQMQGRSTGIEVPFGKFAWISTFRDGLIIHAKIHMSQAEALETCGLSPSPGSHPKP